MRLLSIYFCITLIFGQNLLAQPAEANPTQLWLNQRYQQLQKQADYHFPKSSLKEFPFQSGNFRYYPTGNGLIEFADKSWIILLSHSSHTDANIGDITLIKTHQGKYYTNYGHCCHTLMLNSPRPIQSLTQFLLSTGINQQKEKESWQLYPPSHSQ